DCARLEALTTAPLTANGATSKKSAPRRRHRRVFFLLSFLDFLDHLRFSLYFRSHDGLHSTLLGLGHLLRILISHKSAPPFFALEQKHATFSSDVCSFRNLHC
ncbi:MAG: hypothetical protein RSD95_08180, partial [Clostridia bacterium]